MIPKREVKRKAGRNSSTRGPAPAGFGFTAGEADEDQAKIRRREI
jgi:hypothetical protein